MRDVILFDLDGTLVDSARDIASVLSGIAAARGRPGIAAAQVRRLVALGVEQLVATALGSRSADLAADIADFRVRLRGLAPDPDALFEDVRPVLAHLEADGYTLAVVSNKPEALCRSLLSAYGLAHCFAAIVGGDTTSHAKPHPQPVRHALSMIGATADRALFVGDTAIDAGAAAAAGAIPFLLFEGGYGGPDDISAHLAATRFGRFADLPRIIALIGKRGPSPA